jgi:hypothetical protein
MSSLIVLFPEFGADNICVRQLKAALLQHLSTSIPFVNLVHNASRY